MECKVTKYNAKCLEFQQVKTEHKHLAGLLNPLFVPEWKLEVMTMDFITGLPKTKKQNDSSMVVVDTFSKQTHFIRVKCTYKVVHIVEIFIKDIF